MVFGFSTDQFSDHQKTNYRKLNELGQEKAYEYIESLSEQEKYAIKVKSIR